MTGAGPHATHEVLNQVPPLAGYDVAQDAALLAALAREGGGFAEPELHELGRLAGSAVTQEHARLANTSSRCCARMTPVATASMRSISTPPGTS